MQGPLRWLGPYLVYFHNCHLLARQATNTVIEITVILNFNSTESAVWQQAIHPKKWQENFATSKIAFLFMRLPETIRKPLIFKWISVNWGPSQERLHIHVLNVLLINANEGSILESMPDFWNILISHVVWKCHVWSIAVYGTWLLCICKQDLICIPRTFSTCRCSPRSTNLLAPWP